MQLQLREQGEVVRGDVGVWTTRDAVLLQPLGVQGPQDAQDTHVSLGIENVVDHALVERYRERENVRQRE